MLKAPELVRGGESLESFLVANHLLLAVLAVFAALLGMSNGMAPTWLGRVLSFVFIAGLVLVWLEVLGKIPQKVGGRLFLFRYVLLWGVGGIIFYWLYEYRMFWDITLWIPVSLIIMFVTLNSFLPIVRSFWITRKIFGIDAVKKSALQITFRALAIIGLCIFSFVNGVYLSVGTNIVLDTLKKIPQ